MAFCTSCGQKKDSLSESCPACGAPGIPVIEENVYNKPATENNANNNTSNSTNMNDGSLKYANAFEQAPAQSPNEQKKMLSNAMKVFLVAISIMVVGIGPIFGLILAIVLMGKESQDHKSFGKALLVLCAIILVLYIVCACLSYIVGGSIINNLQYEFNNEFYHWGDGIPV